MARIGIFRDGIYPSGGIETWLFNIATRWGKTHDITIYFDHADEVQLKRLQPKHVTTMDEYDGKIKGLEIVK